MKQNILRLLIGCLAAWPLLSFSSIIFIDQQGKQHQITIQPMALENGQPLADGIYTSPMGGTVTVQGGRIILNDSAISNQPMRTQLENTPLRNFTTVPGVINNSVPNAQTNTGTTTNPNSVYTYPTQTHPTQQQLNANKPTMSIPPGSNRVAPQQPTTNLPTMNQVDPKPLDQTPGAPGL